MREIRIICTIGPASNTFSLLRKMKLAGMNVARLNFSHCSLNEHGEIISLIRTLNKKYSCNIGLLGDLEGYRIRIGKLKNDIPLEEKQTLILSNEAISGDNRIVPFDYTGDLRKIRSGSLIFIDDGNIELKVISSNKSCVKTKVVIPGVLKEQKGINIPGMNFTFNGLTDKDRANIEFCVKNKTDFIAQSFVRNKKDILVFRDSVKDRSPNCKIIAKIENQQGIKNIDEIIAVSDGIMIARGDMGVSMPIYEIAVMQKMIIRKCNRMKKFVITATQMLESMTEHLRPTRAEVTDVANAFLDGSDYLMLSAESAVGKYPVESVKMMDQIIKFTRTHMKDIERT